MHLHGSRCCSTCLCKKSAHPQVITCLIVRCLSTHWSLPLFRVSLHVFPSLHLLYSAQPPCGRNRRVQEPLRTRRMRVWPCGVSKPSCTPECQFYKTDTGCKAGVKCLFPHHKVDEQPNKMPKKGYYSHKRRESDDKNAAATAENCTTIGLRLARLGSTGFSKKKTALGTPDAKVLGTIRRIRFTQSTLRQASIREQNGLSLGNISQKSSSAKSLRYEIWGPVPWRDWKTTAMRPKQGMEPCQKQIQAQRERQSYILLARGGMGTPGCFNKRAGGKRVCSWFNGDRILETERWSSEQNLSTLNIGLAICGRARWKEAGGNNQRFQFFTDPSGQEILYFLALQGHSGRNSIDASLQDNVLIPIHFFDSIYHFGCAVNLHYHKFRIDSGRTKFQQGQTGGILYSRESHAQESPRSKRAWSDQTTSCILPEKWKVHQDTVYWSTYSLLSGKDWIEFLSNKVERSHPTRYTPSLLYLEGDCDEIWRSHIPESVCVTSTTTENFLQR